MNMLSNTRTRLSNSQSIQRMQKQNDPRLENTKKLHSGFFHHNSNRVKEAMNAPYDPMYKNINGDILIHCAAANADHIKNGQEYFIQIMYSTGPSKMNIRNQLGETPLIVAAKNNQKETVETLLNKEYERYVDYEARSPGTQENPRGFSAYDWAKFNENPEMMKSIDNAIARKKENPRIKKAQEIVFYAYQHNLHISTIES